MYYLAASGICLAALVGSAIWESRRMKEEEKHAKTLLKDFRRQALENRQ